MAAIANARDQLLQAASPRILPVTIPIDKIEGLPDALKRIEITASAPAFTGVTGTTTPSSITLTAELKQGLTGSVTWSVASGSATLTPSGAGNANCSVLGSSVSGISVTVRASVTQDGKTFSGVITLPRYGAQRLRTRSTWPCRWWDSWPWETSQATAPGTAQPGQPQHADGGSAQRCNTGDQSGHAGLRECDCRRANCRRAVRCGRGLCRKHLRLSDHGWFVHWQGIYRRDVHRHGVQDSGEWTAGTDGCDGRQCPPVAHFGASGSEIVRLGDSSRNYIRGDTGTDGLELLEISNNSGRAIKVSATNGVGISILTLPGAGTRKPHIVLDAIPSSHAVPDRVVGGIAYHSAHGFIFATPAAGTGPAAGPRFDFRVVHATPKHRCQSHHPVQ